MAKHPKPNGPEELEQAKNLFLDQSEKTIQEIISKEGYQLRNRNMASTTQSTWIDDDNSENYDPTPKNKKKRKQRKTASEDGKGNSSKKSRSASPENPKSGANQVSAAFLSSLAIYQENSEQENQGDLDEMAVDRIDGRPLDEGQDSLAQRSKDQEDGVDQMSKGKSDGQGIADTLSEDKKVD